MSKLLPGERILWEGQPEWRAVARDVVRVGWIAAYFGVVLFWNAVTARLQGQDLSETAIHCLPLVIIGVVVVAASAAFAWTIARTTRYTIPTERCILRYGVALTARLSIPLRRLAAVSVAVRDGGASDIPLRLKPGKRLRYVKLWPHARPWHWSVTEPMLRGVPSGAVVAALLSQAAARVTPGVLHAAAVRGRETVVAGPVLSPTGD